MTDQHIVFLVVIVLAVIALAWWWALYSLKKSREAWRAEADRRGFAYEQDLATTQSRHGQFKIFGLGHSQRVIAAISGRASRGELTLVDYSYTTGSGRSRREHRQTLCLLTSSELRLPHFFVRPQVVLFDLLGKVFGGQDINFDEDPSFSKAFVLQGHDPEATRQLFDQGLRSYFVHYRDRKLQVEGWEHTLLVHVGKHRKPGQTQDLEDAALGLCNQLQGRKNSHE